jgi:hypothetical protein
MPKNGSPMYEKERAVRLWVAYLSLAVASWVGCMPARILTVIKPAEVSLEGISTLAVLKFDGPSGEIVRTRICNRLAEVQHFRSIDISQLRAIENMTYGQIDHPMLYPALRELEADGVITGRVTDAVYDIHGTDRVEVTEGTDHYKREKNVSGEWVDVEIKRTVIRPVPYIIRQGSLDTEYNLFDVRTKRVIATGILKETYDEKFGGDNECGPLGHKLSDLPTPDGTVNELAARLAAKLVAKISRMKLARMIKLDEGGNRMVMQGVELAKAGLWEEAVEIWTQAIHDEPDNAAAYYNLGVAYEGLGDMNSLRMAGELYNKAASFGHKKLYRAAAARVEVSIKESHTH